MRKTRNASTFNLSFLDVMSCGLGAAVLIFLILRHAVESPNSVQTPQERAEINLLEEEIKEGEENLVRIRNTISQISNETVIAQGLAERIQEKIDTLRSQLETLTPDQSENIESLKQKIQKLTAQKRTLEENPRRGNKAYEYTGDGQRQYLTGIKLGGDNVLILLDASASMLDNTLVNVIRRRNMSEQNKLLAPKWRRAVSITQWIVANLPLTSDVQILTFNTDITEITDADATGWEEVSNHKGIADSMAKLTKVVPENGTNFSKVLEKAMQLKPLPDNIFLITDGLPTQGKRKNRKKTVSGRERLSLFRDAIAQLDASIPVNTILLPLEGDPFAAAAFWRLAIRTNGSFITPAQDWP